MRELPWWAYALIGVAAVVAALILHYLHADRFPLVGTITAIAVYLGTFWSLIAAISRFLDGRETNSVRSEIIGNVILVAAGAAAGGVSGAVWWLATAPDAVSLLQAVAGGAMLGGLAVVFLLGGY